MFSSPNSFQAILAHLSVQGKSFDLFLSCMWNLWVLGFFFPCFYCVGFFPHVQCGEVTLYCPQGGGREDEQMFPVATFG